MREKALSIFILIAAVAVISLYAAPGLAQTSKGTIAGVVTDQNGSVVGGAEVELKNPATNQSRLTTTNDAGLYRFDAVDLAIYDLKVTAKGFRTLTSTGIAVQAGRVATLNL